MPITVPHAALVHAARYLPTLLALALLAACGAAPQTPAAQPSTSPVVAASPAPSAYPAPDTALEPGYPAPDAEPTAYPAPLGEAPQNTVQTPASASAPAPTRPPMVATAAPASTAGSTAPALTSLPPGLDVGEVPPDLALVALSDLIQRAGVAVDAITVVSGEAVEWPDGGVGCPRPGAMYPQVITPGYKLVLAANGREYNYHSSEQGPFFLCER